VKRRPSRERSGQSLLEFAFVLPMLLVLIINVVNFGGMFYAFIAVSNGARAGADYLIMGNSTLGAPSAPAATAVTNLVRQELDTLPNRDSLVVVTCMNNNGLLTPAGCGGGTLVADPEAPFFVSTLVDVTYTYEPFLPLWDVPVLGWHTTVPALTIHRTAIMRME
jgi:Flp pilus assembly protein TadG